MMSKKGIDRKEKLIKANLIQILNILVSPQIHRHIIVMSSSCERGILFEVKCTDIAQPTSQVDYRYSYLYNLF